MTKGGCAIAPFSPVIASEAWQSQESQNSKISRPKKFFIDRKSK
jgi:hypothetical protein